jgi:hypothetical protein
VPSQPGWVVAPLEQALPPTTETSLMQHLLSVYLSALLILIAHLVKIGVVIGAYSGFQPSAVGALQAAEQESMEVTNTATRSLSLFLPNATACEWVMCHGIRNRDGGKTDQELGDTYVGYRHWYG